MTLTGTDAPLLEPRLEQTQNEGLTRLLTASGAETATLTEFRAQAMTEVRTLEAATVDPGAGRVDAPVPPLTPSAPAVVSAPPVQERPTTAQPHLAAEQVQHAVEIHARFLARGESVEFHMRLDPPELGTVRVHLTASREGLSAHLIVNDEATRQLLEGQLHLLRQRLTEVTVFAGQFTASDQNASHHADQRQGRGRRMLFPEPPATIQPSLSLMEDDRLDVMA